MKYLLIVNLLLLWQWPLAYGMQNEDAASEFSFGKLSDAPPAITSTPKSTAQPQPEMHDDDDDEPHNALPPLEIECAAATHLFDNNFIENSRNASPVIPYTQNPGVAYPGLPARQAMPGKQDNNVMAKEPAKEILDTSNASERTWRFHIATEDQHRSFYCDKCDKRYADKNYFSMHVCKPKLFRSIDKSPKLTSSIKKTPILSSSTKQLLSASIQPNHELHYEVAHTYTIDKATIIILKRDDDKDDDND